jgi:hypothetical protein
MQPRNTSSNWTGLTEIIGDGSTQKHYFVESSPENSREREPNLPKKWEPAEQQEW